MPLIKEKVCLTIVLSTTRQRGTLCLIRNSVVSKLNKTKFPKAAFLYQKIKEKVKSKNRLRDMGLLNPLTKRDSVGSEVAREADGFAANP